MYFSEKSRAREVLCVNIYCNHAKASESIMLLFNEGTRPLNKQWDKYNAAFHSSNLNARHLTSAGLEENFNTVITDTRQKISG